MSKILDWIINWIVGNKSKEEKIEKLDNDTLYVASDASIADTLRMERIEQEISQRRIADKIGVHQSTISTFETNSHETRYETVVGYAEALGYKKILIYIK